MSQNRITAQMIEDSFKQLDKLADDEYGRKLPQLVDSLKEEHGMERMYFGRLMGIMLKEPFSKIGAAELQGTKRHWELLPERFHEPDKQSTWQFQVIKQLQKESLDYQEESYATLEAMTENVKRETGFFWHLLRSFRKYVCKDPEFSKQLKETVDELHRNGISATLPSASIAATLATLLASKIPWFGIASAPLITGVVLLVWKIGCDAFCSWSDDIIKSRVWYRDS